MTHVQTTESPTFRALGLAPQLLDTLDKLQFVTPTPIQFQAIPAGLTGDDIIGIAQTGTGKTLAFALPILHRFIQQGNRSRGRALIILPTRELALQVEEVFSKVGRPFGLKTAVLIGGAPIRPQQSDLRRNPDIIVATPGRLIDHLQQRNVDLRTVDTLILDEADRMLDMGFAPQIKQILREVPEERQTLLFSATMPAEIVDIAKNYMQTPMRIEVARAGTTADQVTQEVIVVPQEKKNDVMADLLREYSGTVLIFARTRSRASRVARTIKNMGWKAAEIHSDRTLPQRRAALDGFKNGTYRVLVATDIAARGIDVTNIQLVLNYDLPDSADDYVHRIGRTARAGQDGHAISLAAPDQSGDWRDIEKLVRAEIEPSARSLAPFERPAAGNRASRSRRGPSHSSAPRSSSPRGGYDSRGEGGASTGERPRGDGASRPFRGSGRVYRGR